MRRCWWAGRPAVLALLTTLISETSCGTAILDPVSGGADDMAVVAHWRFDETAGRVARDSSRNQRDGVLAGGNWVPGRFGGGLDLRRGDQVTVANFPQAGASFTISFWVRFSAGDLTSNRTSMVGNESNGGGWDVNAPDGSTPPMVQFAYPVPGGGGGSGHASVSCCTPTVDSWMHITAIREGAAGTLSMFHGQTKGGSVSPAPPILPGSATLSIGGPQFQGTVDEIRIYDRALTASEISALDRAP